MNRDKMLEWLRQNEGYNNMPYLDTVGKLTIGYGRNIADEGISRDEAELMLNNDLDDAIKDAESFFWFHYQPESVKDAITNMVFNMGLPRVKTFKKMIEALIVKNYTVAAQEALDSNWAIQVGQRARDIALMIRMAT